MGLLSCYTGSTENGFAQNLANKLNIRVTAPNDILWAYPNGRMVVAPPSIIDVSKPDLSKIGGFVDFMPGGNIRK